MAEMGEWKNLIPVGFHVAGSEVFFLVSTGIGRRFKPCGS